MIRLFLPLLIIGLLSSLQGQGLELFEAANAAYEARDYGKAITQYQTIIEEGNISPEVYHNLGNALAQTQQYGPAMLAYERGLKLQPNHPALISDKNYLKDVIESDIFEVPAFLPVRVWRGFCRLLPANLWVLLQLLSLGGIVYYLAQIWLRPSKIQPDWLRLLKRVSVVTAILCTLVLTSLWYQYRSTQSAIVMNPSVLYSGPDSRSEAIGEMKAGEKVKIIEDFGDWMKVELLNLDEGYLMTSELEEI